MPILVATVFLEIVTIPVICAHCALYFTLNLDVIIAKRELTVAKKIAKKEWLSATNVQNSVKNFSASNFNVQISPRNSFFRLSDLMTLPLLISTGFLKYPLELKKFFS